MFCQLRWQRSIERCIDFQQLPGKAMKVGVYREHEVGEKVPWNDVDEEKT